MTFLPYDLILKNKERLLSFEEPTRFIFSHSALREGWDNPNVFQICTLKHSDSTTQKRQEVGRGLRLCVNKDGNRMDAEVLGDKVQDINVLTVIASESYAGFVDGLQKQTEAVLYDRPERQTLHISPARPSGWMAKPSRWMTVRHGQFISILSAITMWMSRIMSRRTTGTMCRPEHLHRCRKR